MSADSNPGAATPSSLYEMYKSSGALQANPYTLRRELTLTAQSDCKSALAFDAPSFNNAVSCNVPTHISLPIQKNKSSTKPRYVFFSIAPHDGRRVGVAFEARAFDSRSMQTGRPHHPKNRFSSSQHHRPTTKFQTLVLPSRLTAYACTAHLDSNKESSGRCAL